MITIKSIDTLTISECCKILGINPKELKRKTINYKSLPKNEISIRLKHLIEKEEEVYRACKSKEEYEKYLNSWSDGLHRAEAQAALQQLNPDKPQVEQENQTFSSKGDKQKHIFTYIMITILFIICMWLFLDSSGYAVAVYILITITLITVAILHNTIKKEENK